MKFAIRRGNVDDAVSQLEKGLDKLSFVDNFQGWEESIELEAGAEARIKNRLRDTIPRGFFVVDVTGMPTLVRGETEWGTDYVYLKNVASTSTVTAKVFFYR